MMADVKLLVNLLGRVEQSRGPDVDLAIEINEAFGIASYITDDGDPTESIDAALALAERVLPGFEEVRLQVSLPRGAYCNASLYMDTFTQRADETFIAAGLTAPLAVVAAILLAAIKGHA